MSERLTIKRADFINNIVSNHGLTYVQASAAWDSFIKTIDDGICAGAKIQLGKIGAIVPVKLEPRSVNMYFSREKGMVKPLERTYFLGTRVKFKFKLFKGFLESRTLNWKLG